MSLRPVRIYGDPVLRTRAADVREFDGSLAQLVQDLFETMSAYRGVGLAANQVGVLQRVLVVDVPAEEEGGAPLRLALVNPTVTRRAGTQHAEEGCLSIPGVWEDVTRAARIHVEGLDPHGRLVALDATGYAARALQHEIDHLDGVLFVDRLSALKRQFLRRQLDALARGELPHDYQPPVREEQR
ncbi:MAG TPA: peptide deformylase [Candidatus Eisenbacteria bacterium]|nr:peptide deformylase [Candidatus Eisenbacteria bacterium]